MPVSLLLPHCALVMMERLKLGSMYGCQYQVNMSALVYLSFAAVIASKAWLTSPPGTSLELHADLLVRGLEDVELAVAVEVEVAGHDHVVAHLVCGLGVLAGGGGYLADAVGALGIAQRVEYLVGLVGVVGERLDRGVEPA